MCFSTDLFCFNGSVSGSSLAVKLWLLVSFGSKDESSVGPLTHEDSSPASSLIESPSKSETSTSLISVSSADPALAAVQEKKNFVHACKLKLIGEQTLTNCLISSGNKQGKQEQSGDNSKVIVLIFRLQFFSKP